MEIKLLHLLADGLGMIGVVSILLAYWLLQRDSFKPDLLYYYVMNLVGASLVVFSLIFHWNTPAFMVQGSFVLISIWAIIKTLRQRAKKSLT